MAGLVPMLPQLFASVHALVRTLFCVPLSWHASQLPATHPPQLQFSVHCGTVSAHDRVSESAGLDAVVAQLCVSLHSLVLLWVPPEHALQSPKLPQLQLSVHAFEFVSAFTFASAAGPHALFSVLDVSGLPSKILQLFLSAHFLVWLLSCCPPPHRLQSLMPVHWLQLQSGLHCPV